MPAETDEHFHNELGIDLESGAKDSRAYEARCCLQDCCIRLESTIGRSEFAADLTGEATTSSTEGSRSECLQCGRELTERQENSTGEAVQEREKLWGLEHPKPALQKKWQENSYQALDKYDSRKNPLECVSALVGRVGFCICVPVKESSTRR